MFVWAVFLCSATDFYPVLKELIWDFYPSLDLFWGFWFMRRGWIDRDTEWSQHFQQPHWSPKDKFPRELDTALSPALNTETNIECDIKFFTASVFPLIVRTPFQTDLNFHLISNLLCCSFRTFLANSWGFCLILFLLFRMKQALL